MPLLFSEGVLQERLDIGRFVEITAAGPARIYGMYPQKGTIAVGSDADLVLWDPQETRTVTAERLHDNVGYTPYEGRSLRGWPVMTLSRGRVVTEGGKLIEAPGSGRFIERHPQLPASDLRP